MRRRTPTNKPSDAPNMPRKDRIDALGATALSTFSFLLGINQGMIKMVKAGMGPV